MEYFNTADKGVYRWKQNHKVEIRFSDSQLKFCYDGKPILSTKCDCKKFIEFQAALVDLDNFWENPPVIEEKCEKLPFPSRLFLRHFLCDAYSMFNNPEFIENDSNEAMFLSLALFNLIRRKRKNLYEEISKLYNLMNFCREKTIARYFSPARRFDFIEYVRLVCKWWIEICTEIRFVDGEKGGERDPEIEIAKVLWNEQESTNHSQDDILDTKLGLYKFWNPRGTEMRTKFRGMINYLTEWFLKRYNLKAAIRLLDAQRYLDELEQDNTKKSSFQQITELLRITGRVLKFTADKTIYTKPWFPLIIFLLALVIGVVYPTPAEYLFSLGFLILIVYGVLLIIHFLFNRDTYWFKRMLPRLFGGIVVGYLPLLMTEEMWKFCLKVTWPFFIQILIIVLGASFVYLHVEVNNTIRDRNAAYKRAFSVLILGCSESLIIGLVFCSLFGSIFLIDEGYTTGQFIHNLPKEIDAPVLFGLCKNWVHFVYPPVVLLYFPLALFIGIFVQILWEDKPITAPL